MTTSDVKEGQELFTYYGYGVNVLPADFPWYWELRMKTEKNERLEAKRLADEQAKTKTVKIKTKQIKKNKK